MNTNKEGNMTNKRLIWISPVLVVAISAITIRVAARFFGVWAWLPWILVLFFVAMALRWDRFLPKPAVFGRFSLQLSAWIRGRSRVQGAAALGLATPLLPCGPLYFLLTLALLSGSALRGVEFMLAFGLGTVPLLWLLQSQAGWIRSRLSPLWLGRLRLGLALATALVISWRLRATLGFAGPDPSTFLCH